jgi:hypothetical protein
MVHPLISRPLLSGIALIAVTLSAHAEAPARDQIAIFAAAAEAGHTGIARKTKPVDARAASAGEVVVTVIKGEGVETRSKPAEAGDMVVRNRCPETGNEEYLVKAAKFPARYGEPQSDADAKGWRAFAPKGGDMRYMIVTPEIGEFSFKAPWGEPMVAKVGDALVQTPTDATDTYRVAASSFACTYEITTPAK